ncbi:MAG: DUF2863 family protein [Zoogloeaceae bacterium]|jgi:hypothetical protein|nr:DUF2863 family protein [Zoogloeaceae bacterium]
MKRSRFGARDRLPRDAAELQRLSIGLSESGGRLEDLFWETRLADLVLGLLKSGAEDDLTTAMDRLFESHPQAHDELISMVESFAEAQTLEIEGHLYDVQLFAAPILAWSRYGIPACPLGSANLNVLKVQLGAHVFSAEARLSLVDYLFSPDQLPRSFCDVWQLTKNLGEQALTGDNLRLDTQGLPETNRFLSDVRYLIGVSVVPHGAAIFRWNEPDGSRENAHAAWIKQGSPSLASLFTGCAYHPLLADAYHSACRQGDLNSRPYALKASVAFLQTTLGLLPEEMRAVIVPCHEQRLEEYRVGLAPRDQDNAAYQGVVWALLGAEDEHTDIVAQIDATLRECGLKDILNLDHIMPMEFCDDCGAPLFPTAEGELVHADMPEQSDAMPQTLH